MKADYSPLPLAGEGSGVRAGCLLKSKVILKQPLRFPHSRRKLLHLGGQLDRSAGNHEGPFAEMMDRPRTFFRGVDPRFEHFQNEEAILLRPPRIDDRCSLHPLLRPLRPPRKTPSEKSEGVSLMWSRLPIQPEDPEGSRLRQSCQRGSQ